MDVAEERMIEALRYEGETGRIVDLLGRAHFTRTLFPKCVQRAPVKAFLKIMALSPVFG